MRAPKGPPELEGAVGTLSRTSKMPCPSYGLPAGTGCPVGGKLAKVSGSVCSKCYAMRGRYVFANVREPQERRLRTVYTEGWTDNMVKLIGHLKTPFFRWHDSGDLQGAWHLAKITEVAHRLPNTQFWLPTHEAGMVFKELEAGRSLPPPNLTIRLSAPMVNKMPHKDILERALEFGLTHAVVFDDAPPGAFPCGATFTDNPKCGTCRECWSKSTHTVCYKKH